MANQSNILGHCSLNTNYIQQLVHEGGGKIAVNQSQCKCLAQTLELITKNISNIFSHTNELLNNFDLLLKELFRVIGRAKQLVQQCYDEKWWHAALLQIHNDEAFQDLFMDLKSCYDDIWQHLESKSVGHFCQHKKDVSISLPSIKELGIEDHCELMRQLQVTIESTHPSFGNEGLDERLTIARYLLDRYGNLKGKSTNGGHFVEVDARLGWSDSIFLARGAYGSVEKTTWCGLPCAKKVQGLGEMMEDEDKAYKKEVAILASVNHPNVVKFICCGRIPKERRCFIAMELLDTNLEDLIKELSNGGTKTPFTIQVAVDIILQIAKGMSYLHENNIAHWDLKPGNVLVHKIMDEEFHKDNYVNVKLADFGLSKTDVNSNISEKLSQGVGTRLYKAPELFQTTKHIAKKMKYSTGEQVNAHAADVYSFGVMCATILSGKQPFEGIDGDLPSRLRSGERPWLPNGCQEDLVSLIKKCWSLDRTKRPNFKEICTTLRGFRSSIIMDNVVPTNEVAKNETTIFQRILWLPQNVMYLCKHFWMKPNLEVKRDHEAQHASQVRTKGFQLSPPLSWANRILPSQVRSIHSLPILPIHFVNIDNKVSNVLLQLESNQILGIVGMGGSGKTTLTKVILHRVHQGFEATSFVANMRDSKSVLEIQRQLLRDLVKGNRSISTTEEGFNCLKDIFEKRKVFVVFDDVASQEQLHALVSSTWVFANGSKIIATSRNWQDLKATCISHKRKVDMELLDKDQAKELFYKHAFPQTQHERPQFEEVANKIIEACGGLPLSLEVLGGFVCGVDRLRIWEQTLRRLQRGQCIGGSWDNERIWKILRISYDSLNEEEQNVFLDIACFFCRDVLKEGMKEELALRIWNCDGSNTDLVLLNLMDRSLVRVDGDGMLTMHDHLRDMGRMIACKEHNGGQRIWNLHEFEATMIRNVEGLYMGESDCNNNMIATMDMANIRLLHINECENLDYLYTTMKNACNLRWICMSKLGDDRGEGIQEFQPSFFIPLKQLCVLEIKRWVRLHHLPVEIGTLEMLEYFSLCTCTNLELVPHTLGNLPSLVTLELKWCKNLKELPESLGNLISLVTLNLSGCGNLKELPETLGNLTSLVTLLLISCGNLKELPETLGNLASLVTLDLTYCSNLKELPETLGNLTSLVTLGLTNCSNLKELPETLGNLASLVTLDLSECINLKELPETLGNLTSLVTLDLSECINLKELPETLGNLASLVTLDLRFCYNLKELPETLGNLTSLVTMDLKWCKKLKELPKTLGNLTSLVTLNLRQCGNLKELPETLGNLSSLVTLHLSWCDNLKELPETLGNLTSLVTLDLISCYDLKELPETLGNLTSLVTLDLISCHDLKELPETLGNLTSLVTLDLSGCKRLVNLPKTLGNLTSLVTLDSTNCLNLNELPETLGNLISLVTLDLTNCSNLKELPETLGNLTSLVTLGLTNCSNLKELPETLGDLTSLVTLDLTNCSNLKELPETLGNLTSLVTMDLKWCKKLKELPETLGNLASLVTLDLRFCYNLKELPETLGNLTSLVTMDLKWCKKLKELPKTLGNLTSLVTLNLRQCGNLKELPETLGYLSSLVTLNLRQCGNLKELPETLGNLSSLVTLHLSWCDNLKELPETLGNLTSLVTLDLISCHDLKELPETLGNLTSLVTLDLSSCKRLVNLPKTLGNLTSLVTLDSTNCLNLNELPETLGNLISLVTLDLTNCSNLKELPETLGNLTSLVTLGLTNCSNLKELPETLGDLTSLVTLDLTNCSNLKELPETLGNLTSLVTLDLSGCKWLEELPETLGNLMSLVTLKLSGCKRVEELPTTLGNLMSLVHLDLEDCWNLRRLPRQLMNLIKLDQEMIGLQENISIGAFYNEATKKREKEEEDEKIFCHLSDQPGDAIDQRPAQNNNPVITYDRRENTSALEGPKSEEPLYLQGIVCPKDEGVTLNMQNLESDCEDHSSFATMIVGEMVDDSLRLCFEDGESMSRMVGVGLDHAVVMVNSDYEILVEGNSKDIWTSLVSKNGTMIERLNVKISTYGDSLEGVSHQPLDPVRLAKSLGVGIDGPGKCTNLEKKQSVPCNAVIELVKIMFWTRFQSHTKSNIDAKSNGAKVQGRAHGAKNWDLKVENEDDLKCFEVPPSWWSTKWWQNSAVHDIQLNTRFSFNMESSSDKIGRQQSGDDNVQCGKESSSSDEDSKLHCLPFDKINCHGKRKSKCGGDNNDEDDNHDNTKKTCQDSSKVELHVDEADDIISTVCVSVKPKYGCWKPPDADLSQEPAHITPHLKFWFRKSTSLREIKVNTTVMFDLGKYGPTRTSGHTSFGWFHDDIEVSLQSMEHDSSTLKHDHTILQPSTSGKISVRETSGCTSNPSRVSASLPVSSGLFNMPRGLVNWEKRWSPTQTREFEQACEMVNQQSWGGFIFRETSWGGARPRLSYNLKHPYPIPNRAWEKSYGLFFELGICSTVTPAIEGTWEDLNESEASPYLFEAKRMFQKRCKSTMISTRGNETDDDVTEIEQKYHVNLYVNHAMTHMNQFQRLTPVRNKPMEGGLINLQGDFYGKVGHGKLCQEPVA